MIDRTEVARQVHRDLVRRSADLQALHRLATRPDASPRVVVDQAGDLHRELETTRELTHTTVRDALGDAGLAFAGGPTWDEVDVVTQGRRMAELIGAEHRRAQEAMGEVSELMADLARASSTDPGVLEDARASLPTAIGRMEQASRAAWRVSEDLPLLDRAGASAEAARAVDAGVPRARAAAVATMSRGTREELRRLPSPAQDRSARLAR